jgi:hypothetical protein
MNKDQFIPPKDAMTRLEALGYTTRVGGGRLFYNRSGDAGSLHIHDGDYGQGIDDTHVKRIEAAAQRTESPKKD